MKTFLLAAALALALPTAAFAHARVSPSFGLKGESQVYTLAVPTEKDGATTTQIEFSPPSGFNIDSFVPVAGLEAHRAADRLRRERCDHEGHLDRRESPDRGGRSVLVPREYRSRQDVHIRCSADLLGRIRRRLERS